MSDLHSPLARRFGRLATAALIAEATLSPKPGLVTPSSSGAHRDMDYPLLVTSARALGPCFEACAFAGEVAGGIEASPSKLLSTLRCIGQEGEQAMSRATGGINTHKGAIFCLGLLSAAMTFAHVRGMGTDRQGDIACTVVANLCSGLVARELSSTNASEFSTAGERLYFETGARGARGQAEDGYPLLRGRTLPLLRKAHSQGRERFNLACLDALLISMSELEDSCLLARGGTLGLAIARQGAAEVVRLGGASSESGWRGLIELDSVLVRAGLSPGGSADMVAAAIFLVTTESYLAEKSACHPQGMPQLRIA